jgi:hypothetical protein
MIGGYSASVSGATAGRGILSEGSTALSKTIFKWPSRKSGGATFPAATQPIESKKRQPNFRSSTTRLVVLPHQKMGGIAVSD